MFSWLVTAVYLAGNPLSLSRQRARKAQPRVTRYLEDEAWTEVKLAIDALPRDSDREREHYFRLRWLFSLLYLCGLRVSEVTQNRMGGFFCRRDKDSEERWWLEVRSEEHTSELQSLMRISYAVFCLKKKNKETQQYPNHKHMDHVIN